MSTPYTAWLDAWSSTITGMVAGLAAANRAAWTAVGASAPENGSPSGDPETRIDSDVDLAEWTVERSVANDQTLTVGDTVRFGKPVTAADVERFAAATGDTNPLHLDEAWADETLFDGRIVHGTLVAGLISAALARLPGNVIYLSQTLEFRAPVRVGEEPTAVVEVVEDLGEERYRIHTTVETGETLVVEGEAVVLVGEVPASG